jgi:hypothetical protein
MLFQHKLEIITDFKQKDLLLLNILKLYLQ